MRDISSDESPPPPSALGTDDDAGTKTSFVNASSSCKKLPRPKLLISETSSVAPRPESALTRSSRSKLVYGSSSFSDSMEFIASAQESADDMEISTFPPLLVALVAPPTMALTVESSSACKTPSHT